MDIFLSAAPFSAAGGSARGSPRLTPRSPAGVWPPAAARRAAGMRGEARGGPAGRGIPGTSRRVRDPQPPAMLGRGCSAAEEERPLPGVSRGRR